MFASVFSDMCELMSLLVPGMLAVLFSDIYVRDTVLRITTVFAPAFSNTV